MSYNNKLYYYSMKCVSRVASLHEAPSSLRLSVRQPRRGCLPWCSDKHTVATFCFKETLWQHQGVSGEYEQTVECELKNLERLKRLEADLPVKVKMYWSSKGRRPSKVFLQVSLGSLLEQLLDSEAWLAFTATGQEERVCWQQPHHQDDDTPVTDDSLEDSTDPPLLEYDDLWGSSDEEEELPPVPCEEDDGEWVTFFNPSTGNTLRLPRHTEEEAEERWRPPGAWTSLDDLLSWDSLLLHSPWDDERWRGPGAWTSEDDLLSVRALRIVEDIQPVVKKWRGPGAWTSEDDLLSVRALRIVEDISLW